MATRNTDDGDGAHSTSMIRSDCCCSDAALVQSVDLDIAPHGSQDIHVHLVAAISNGLILEFYGQHFDPMWGRIYRHTLRLNEDGTVSPPDVPGIGADPNYEVLEPFRRG